MSVLNEIKFAEDPEFTVIKFFIPINFFSLFSNLSLNLPVVNHPSIAASVMYCISFSSITFPVTLIFVYKRLFLPTF